MTEFDKVTSKRGLGPSPLQEATDLVFDVERNFSKEYMTSGIDLALSTLKRTIKINQDKHLKSIRKKLPLLWKHTLALRNALAEYDKNKRSITIADPIETSDPLIVRRAESTLSAVKNKSNELSPTIKDKLDSLELALKEYYRSTKSNKPAAYQQVHTASRGLTRSLAKLKSIAPPIKPSAQQAANSTFVPGWKFASQQNMLTNGTDPVSLANTTKQRPEF